MGDAHMGKKDNQVGKKIKREIKVNIIPVEGDPFEAICSLIEPNVSSVLAKYGATLKISIREILRNHTKV